MEADESMERRNNLEDTLIKRRQPPATPLDWRRSILFSAMTNRGLEGKESRTFIVQWEWLSAGGCITGGKLPNSRAWHAEGNEA
eukprot:331177-Pyramimonas_sp.AAC.1